MTAGVEVVTVDRWLYGVITGDATLAGIIGTRAYGHSVPPEAEPPFVMWTLASPGEDVMTVNTTRIWANPLYDIRLVMAAEDYTPLETGVAALDAALHRASGSNVSGVIVGCVREAPFAMPEFGQGASQLRHLGGRYRIFVQ